MKEYFIDLTELVNPPKTDSISGREFGIKHAKDKHILEHLDNNEHIVIKIDEKYVKAINDSFIKGFFSKIFEKYKTRENVKRIIEIRSNQNFILLFEKNWTILEAIYNA
jgi:hypothetical protein